MRASPLLALLVLSAACSATQRDQPAPPASTAAATVNLGVVTRTGGRHAVRAELARTTDEHSRGLMYRRTLAPDSGMLFLFDDDEDRAFWMRNTLIPLDMIFAAADGTIVGIVPMATPLTETSRAVGTPSRYVLEMAGGWCQDHGVAAGDRIDLSAVPGRAR